MKQNELKQILKPLIKKCVKEVIFEEGILSGIISEVIKGTNGVVLKEHNVYKNSTPPEKDAYGGIDIFEGTTPFSSTQAPGAEQGYSSPLASVAPGDPGVDISSIPGANVWSKLIK